MVSGGADSMCLLHVLSEIHSYGAGVLTIDHGLRPESAREVEVVARVAEGLGCAVHMVRLDLESGAGLQERAREARMEAARACAEDVGYGAIATGHTASDQAETVLFRLARGTGRTGARGMAPRWGSFVRPLLGVTRDETQAWCRERGIAFVDDPSNSDRRFARVRVRHDLLPALAAVHPEAELHVAAFADRMRDEQALLDGIVDAAWHRCALGEGLAVASLLGENPALRPLLVRRLIDLAGLPGEAGAASVVGRLLQAAEDGRRVDVPGGVALVERGALVVERPATRPAAVHLAVPGTARFGAAWVRARRGAAVPPRPACVAVATDRALVVRPPRPGDRVALSGGGHQSVGRLLAAAGVPARRRPHVPVVATADEVVWVAGHRADPRHLAPAGVEATILTLETV